MAGDVELLLPQTREIVSEMQYENAAFATTWDEMIDSFEDFLNSQDPQNEFYPDEPAKELYLGDSTCVGLNLQIDELDSNLLSMGEIVSQMQNENTAFTTNWGKMINSFEDFLNSQDPDERTKEFHPGDSTCGASLGDFGF
uniref:uncharacterized protein isoform X2 n=1 Tax=Myxine glutinosa TaxID=7769 RepID=UPI00358F8E12